MKTLIAVSICAFASIAQAQTDNCLDDLVGTFSFKAKGILEPSLAIRKHQNSWQFEQPSDPGAGGEKLFRYHFDKAPALPAQPVAQEDLALLGRALLSPFKDKREDLDGIRTECGLMADDIYLVRIDLSGAKQELLRGMVIWARAMSGQTASDLDAPIQTQEIEAIRQQKYFAGEPFRLEGVTSGVVGFQLHKTVGTPP